MNLLSKVYDGYVPDRLKGVKILVDLTSDKKIEFENDGFIINKEIKDLNYQDIFLMEEYMVRKLELCSQALGNFLLDQTKLLPYPFNYNSPQVFYKVGLTMPLYNLNTNTFFVPENFKGFSSEEIEQYAQEYKQYANIPFHNKMSQYDYDEWKETLVYLDEKEKSKPKTLDTTSNVVYLSDIYPGLIPERLKNFPIEIDLFSDEELSFEVDRFVINKRDLDLDFVLSMEDAVIDYKEKTLHFLKDFAPSEGIPYTFSLYQPDIHFRVGTSEVSYDIVNNTFYVPENFKSFSYEDLERYATNYLNYRNVPAHKMLNQYEYEEYIDTYEFLDNKARSQNKNER